MSKVAGMHFDRSRVFILGAGFSAAAGVPLTDDLLTAALNEMRSDVPFLADRIGYYLEIAHQEHSKNKSSSPGVFSNLCTLLEYNELREHGGGERWSNGGSREKLTLRFYLAKVLTQRTPRPNNLPEVYLRFAEQLRDEDILLTFNWDCLLEIALSQVGRPYSYEIKEGCVPIFKMHGSTHWRLRTYEDGPTFNWTRLGFDTFDDIPPLYYSEDLQDVDVWHHKRLFREVEPFLVLPGFGKAFDVRALAQLWYKPEWAFARKNYFIVGLSLTPDDFFIRSYFLCNLPGLLEDGGHSLTVINPDASVERNFQFLPQISSYRFLTEKFSEAHVELMQSADDA